jgi:hypothetical protein
MEFYRNRSRSEYRETDIVPTGWRTIRNIFVQSASEKGHGSGSGKGHGGGNKRGSGPDGKCICPSCGHKEAHTAGQRCKDQTCPKCGTKMIRE